MEEKSKWYTVCYGEFSGAGMRHVGFAVIHIHNSRPFFSFLFFPLPLFTSGEVI